MQQKQQQQQNNTILNGKNQSQRLQLQFVVILPWHLKEDVYFLCGLRQKDFRIWKVMRRIAVYDCGRINKHKDVRNKKRDRTMKCDREWKEKENSNHQTFQIINSGMKKKNRKKRPCENKPLSSSNSNNNCFVIVE